MMILRAHSPLKLWMLKIVYSDLRSRKRDDVRQHAIGVGVRQAVCGILVDHQLAAGDEFMRRSCV